MSKRSDGASLLVVAVVALLGTTAATCQNPQQGRPSVDVATDTTSNSHMEAGGRGMQILHRAPNGDIDTIDVAVKDIRQGNGATIPAALPDAGRREALIQHINTEQNSRLDAPLPAASRWTKRWSKPLRERNIPRHVLQSGDRIVVESPVWELFDLSGKQLWALAAGISPLVLDPEHGHIYFADANGMLRACRLTDGREVFSTMPLFADEFVRPYLKRSGNRLVIAGVERDLDPEKRVRPARSIIELVDLGTSPEVSATGLLVSARNVSSLIFPSTSLVVAGAGDSLVVAIEDHITIVDGDLKIAAAYRGKFLPRSISLDEARRIYLVVTTETGGLALWIISPQGELLRSIELPADLASIDAPPAIGYDHSIYLRMAGGIVAFAATGEKLWEYRPTAPVVGLAVTSDDRLLVSSGSDLSIIDRAGTPTIIQSFPGERIATAAVITATGDIVVATECKLHILTPQR